MAGAEAVQFNNSIYLAEKGSVDRDAIVQLCAQNLWKGIGDPPVSVSLVQDGGGRPPAPSSKTGAVLPVTIYLEWTTIRC